MKHRYRTVSFGNLSLSETIISNVFFFFKKDGTSFFNDDVREMQELAVELLAKYMEFYEQKNLENVAVGLEIAMSKDYKCIKLTFYDKNSLEVGVLH